jgi:hypothetical protein
MATPKKQLEANRAWPFTINRRDRCVKRIMEETGIGKYEAEIAYRISTVGLIGNHSVEEVSENGKAD